MIFDNKFLWSILSSNKEIMLGFLEAAQESPDKVFSQNPFDTPSHSDSPEDPLTNSDSHPKNNKPISTSEMKGMSYMMIRPEIYSEDFFENKPKEEIFKIIRNLKREINRLKKTIERPDYKKIEHSRPNENIQLWCSRLNLKKAIEAYKAIGGDYKPTNAELKALEFDKAIPNISKITLSMGGIFAEPKTKTVTLTNEQLIFSENDFIIPTPIYTINGPMTKDEFLEELQELHIGEWRHYYDSSDYGLWILDGIQWELEIEYADNRRSAKYAGSNAYPFSFDALCSLMDFEKIFEEEEEEEEEEEDEED